MGCTLLGQDRPRPASCPATVFVAGNNPAATEFRTLYADSKSLKLVQKREDSESVLDVDLREVTISVVLTLKDGTLVWSGSATASDFPNVAWGLRKLMVDDLNKRMQLKACGRLIK